jgi:hypothetical protein
VVHAGCFLLFVVHNHLWFFALKIATLNEPGNLRWQLINRHTRYRSSRKELAIERVHPTAVQDNLVWDGC